MGEENGIDMPGQDVIDQWGAFDGFEMDFDSFSDFTSAVCNNQGMPEFSIPNSMNIKDARFGMNLFDAMCNTMTNFNPQYRQNGWSAMMFDMDLADDVQTNCDMEFDRTKVEYDELVEEYLSAGIDGLMDTFFAWDFGSFSLDVPWEDFYHNEDDRWFDNDGVVPIWSSLMCYADDYDNIYKDFENVERAIVYANHESAKHSDEVAKVIAEWMYDKYDGDADGLPDVEDSCQDAYSVWEYEDGIVENDWDGDGIADACDDSNLDRTNDAYDLNGNLIVDQGDDCAVVSGASISAGMIVPSEEINNSRCALYSWQGPLFLNSCDENCCASSPVCGDEKASNTCDDGGIAWSTLCQSYCCTPEDEIYSVAGNKNVLLYGTKDLIGLIDVDEIDDTVGLWSAPSAIRKMSLPLDGPVRDIEIFNQGDETYAFVAVSDGVEIIKIANLSDGLTFSKDSMILTGEGTKDISIYENLMFIANREGISVYKINDGLVLSNLHSYDIAGGILAIQIADDNADGLFTPGEDGLYGIGPIAIYKWDVFSNGFLALATTDRSGMAANFNNTPIGYGDEYAANYWDMMDNSVYVETPTIRVENENVLMGGRGYIVNVTLSSNNFAFEYLNGDNAILTESHVYKENGFYLADRGILVQRSDGGSGSGSGSGACTGVEQWISDTPWYDYSSGNQRVNDNRLWTCHTPGWCFYEPSGAWGYLGWAEDGNC